jgi:hypothetical protein
MTARLLEVIARLDGKGSCTAEAVAYAKRAFDPYWLNADWNKQLTTHPIGWWCYKARNGLGFLDEVRREIDRVGVSALSGRTLVNHLIGSAADLACRSGWILEFAIRGVKPHDVSIETATLAVEVLSELDRLRARGLSKKTSAEWRPELRALSDRLLNEYRRLVALLPDETRRDFEGLLQPETA